MGLPWYIQWIDTFKSVWVVYVQEPASGVIPLRELSNGLEFTKWTVMSLGFAKLCKSQSCFAWHDPYSFRNFLRCHAGFKIARNRAFVPFLDVNSTSRRAGLWLRSSSFERICDVILCRRFMGRLRTTKVRRVSISVRLFFFPLFWHIVYLAVAYQWSDWFLGQFGW